MADSPPTVLVVDDTESGRYAVCRMLRQAGFRVIEADTGEGALRQVAEHRPDLVILDVGLPDLSGYEVCRRLKTDRSTKVIPVMHLSASYVGSEDRSEGLEGGADGYLTYPLEPRELIATVRALMRVRQAERSERAQREFLQVTLSSIGDGVIATDLAGTVTFINPVARGLTGWGEEALGRPVAEVFRLVHEETGEEVPSPVDRVIQTDRKAAVGNQTVLIARDGHRLPIDDTAAPIRDEEGKTIGVILVFRDITERRRLEAEVRRRSEDLAERDRRKDEFLAMLAHELRNPLAPITNTVRYLKSQMTGETDVLRAGAMLERQVVHLTRLVDDLLDVSRITRGKLELRKARVPLWAIVAHAVESSRQFIEERQHRLEVSAPEGDISIEADADRLEQVLLNLLTNAAKYSPPGGIIQLAAAREGGEAVIRVRDRGIGIRPEALPRLFDLFQQADRVPGRVSEGLGIGLTLVRTLVEMHGGTVSASSPGPGQGSEFVVRLPALSLTAEVAPTAPHPTLLPRPVRVLVVDDNVDSANSLAILLRMDGHEVRTAHDGLTALDAAREFRPEAAFLDIGLPRGMDGYELARRLRQEPGLERALLVAMTGYGQPDDVARSHAAGFDHHVTKPADLDAVAMLLAHVPPRSHA